MAKKSKNLRIPGVKVILLFALVASLLIGVWSLNNVPTETRSDAATTSCGSKGGACYKYNCSAGYTRISGTCGNMADSACCTKTSLSKPTKLKTNYSYCKLSGSSTTYTNANLEWYHSDMKYSTSYVVYYRKYNSGASYISVTIPKSKFDGMDPNYGTYFFHPTGLSKSSKIQWYVTAKNIYSGASAKSDTIVSSTPYLSCP